MKETRYYIHPYCFLLASPEARFDISLSDCTHQASQVEVHNEDGFIYSEFNTTGTDAVLKVGYRLPEVASLASSNAFLAEVLVEDALGRQFGSIVGGIIISPTKIKPAMYIQCGDRAHGGDPRIVDAARAGLTYTTAATMKLCLNPELRQEVHVVESDNPASWKSHSACFTPEVVTTASCGTDICNDPTKQAGTLVHLFDSVTRTVRLTEVEIDGSKLVIAS